MPVDFNADAVNERLIRLETEVDSVKADMTEQKVAVARLGEQVQAHEKRGEERHQQILTALTDMKIDYRDMLQTQHEASKLRSEQQTRILLAVIALISSIAGAIWSFSPDPVIQIANPASIQPQPK